jgi:hypothetical protein
MAEQPKPVEVSILLDVLYGISKIYENIPAPYERKIAESKAAQHTIYNLYNHWMLLLWRARIHLQAYEQEFLIARNSIILAIHRAHGTNTMEHSVHENGQVS